MSSRAISPRELEGIFARDLEKLTTRATESRYRQLKKTDDMEKRDVFDVGLRDWAESLAGCAAGYVELFRSLVHKRKGQDGQSLAEQKIWNGLFAFLGVDLTLEPEPWPDSNRIQVFTRSVCFCGPLLPAWFDVGFMQAAGLGPHPPTRMGKELSLQHVQSVHRKFSRFLIDELLDAFDREAVRLSAPAIPLESPSLPPKSTDLSRYFDSAQLSDRQKECLSLKFEYGLSAYAIAKRLRLHTSTVDESLASGGKRLERTRDFRSEERRAAKSPSQYHDVGFRK